MTDLVRARRALLSVSDKSGVVGLARTLHSHGAEILSTGGTARTLRDAGVSVRLVEDFTGFPEMLDGRVKTLHPRIHAGLLGLRDSPDHAETMREHGLEPIDLVCIDLYPFEREAARHGAAFEEVIEQIDIGGPSMIRSGAKNFAHVAVISDSAQIPLVADELTRLGGSTTLALRRELAAAAFERTCAFDAAIAGFLRTRAGDLLPPRLCITGERTGELRYGENPHQHGALYLDRSWSGPSAAGARTLHGKTLSYNNYLDASAALDTALALARAGLPAACVVKHTNPCGAACARTGAEALDAAIAGDPLASYGGIVALSGPVGEAEAQRLCAEDAFFEVVIAPRFEPAALGRLRARWKNVRLLETDGGEARARIDVRTIAGGFLVQEHDSRAPTPGEWTLGAGPAPDAERLAVGAALEVVCRALSSNAIAIGGVTPGGARALFGAGAGQMDRVAACRLAVEKAGERARGAVAVSDAFFPFPDGPRVLIDAGVATIIHPGGSKRDAETFELCASRGVTCLTTGVRRFRH